MKIFKKLIFIIVGFASLMVYAAYYQNPELSITNESPLPHQPSPSPFPHPSALPSPAPQGIQVARSMLGLEVKFQNGNVNYPGLTITNDQRYQALAINEKLVDAIQFQSMQAPPFLLLIAIAKKPDGTPLIIPGKFDIIHKTEQEGFVLKDAQGRLFYYSGYLLITSAWKDLAPGQILQDKFCKDPAPLAMCPARNTVNVMLKKPSRPSKDIPLLAFVR